MNDTVEKIRKYIKGNNAKIDSRYDATFKEVCAIASELSAVDAVVLAFEYGRIKGYRAAKAEKGAAI